MEYILLFVIILLASYIVYKDILNARMLESLQLKLMSKDVHEYKSATEEEVVEEKKKEEDPYLPIEDVPYARMVEAKQQI